MKRPFSNESPSQCMERPSEFANYKIVVISHGFQTNYERGFCNGLAAHRLAVTLIGSDRTDYSGLKQSIRTINMRGSQEENRSKLHKLANMIYYHLRLLAFSIPKKSVTIHVIGLTQPPLICGLFEGIWFRVFNRLYVLTVHNLLPHDRHTGWMKMTHLIVYRLPHYLVVHTQAMRNEVIKRFGVSPKRVLVMEHGIEPLRREIQCPSPDVLKKKMNLLFFGIVAHYKGLDILLEALRLTTLPFILTIAGTSTNKKLIGKLNSEIENHPKRNAIQWRNEFIPDSDVQGLFENADVVVLPYRHIDQSGVLFQALRHGTPVIATRVGSFAEYIADRNGELCAPDDAESLAAALDRLYMRLPTLSRRQIAESAKDYEWQKTVRALMPVYQLNVTGGV